MAAHNDEVNFRAKILSREQLLQWRDTVRDAGKKLVVTNGCFDLLHAGHVTYLEAARNLGDALLVGVTADSWVRDLKGLGRPVNSQDDRAAVLAAVESVDGVFIFPEKTAETFLTRVQPDIYVKGGDYTIDTINQEERRIIEGQGGRIVIVPAVPGKSTTAILERLAK